jgi:glutamate 5-kinase
MSRRELARAKRVVVKIGTSLLTPAGDAVQSRRFASFAKQIAAEIAAKRAIVLVASGAVGLGTRRLGLSERPRSIPGKQAAAAVGQIDLCRRFERAFARQGCSSARCCSTAPASRIASASQRAPHAAHAARQRRGPDHQRERHGGDRGAALRR